MEGRKRRQTSRRTVHHERTLGLEPTPQVSASAIHEETGANGANHVQLRGRNHTLGGVIDLGFQSSRKRFHITVLHVGDPLAPPSDGRIDPPDLRIRRTLLRHRGAAVGGCGDAQVGH